MATPKRYHEEFKRDAIRLQEMSGKSVWPQSLSPERDFFMNRNLQDMPIVAVQADHSENLRLGERWAWGYVGVPGVSE